jgi:hypothetical protein
MIAANKRMKSNLIINKTIQIMNGSREINKSGIISFHDISFLQNFTGSPLLKNKALSLPFPNPQVLPQ